MHIRWTSDEIRSAWGIASDGRTIVRLVVEQTPGGSWDWVVWPDDSRDECRAGVSNTRCNAKEFAEAAARSIASASAMARDQLSRAREA
jgi:hypothetical protein